MSRYLLAVFFIAASLGAAPAAAQDNYPTKPIRIVLPVPAGSALDIAARALGEQLRVAWASRSWSKHAPVPAA